MFKQIEPFSIEVNDINFTSIAHIITKHHNVLKELPFINVDSIDHSAFTNINKMELVKEINDGRCDFYETKTPVSDLKFGISNIRLPDDFACIVTVSSTITKVQAVISQKNDLIFTTMKGCSVEELIFTINPDYTSFDALVKDNNIDDTILTHILDNGMPYEMVVDLKNGCVIHKDHNGKYALGEVVFCRYPKTVSGLTIDDTVHIINIDD